MTANDMVFFGVLVLFFSALVARRAYASWYGSRYASVRDEIAHDARRALNDPSRLLR